MLITWNINIYANQLRKKDQFFPSCFIRNFSIVYEIFFHFVLFSCFLRHSAPFQPIILKPLANIKSLVHKLIYLHNSSSTQRITRNKPPPILQDCRQMQSHEY